ncbi:hypothetical protein B0H63DRAFT_554786 [Podospora didyma]|uniref:Zn(2)-C6 fungal-type domain-containing protein n=1 Tax=Podospora didyma TaxID=330526 RepID=A0AAE0U732_9PEZI|nr:hypothetical protein B0H63DRAFT_554786 [Podospora didyma]
MASTFRPIQSSSPTPWAPSVTSFQGLGKRIRNVAEACRDCRVAKVKCDGSRPKCRTCVAKDRPCYYDGRQGQSRKALMKSRMRAMEKVFEALKANPASDAENLLQRIRASDDILALAEASDVVSSPGSGGLSPPTAFSIDRSLENRASSCEMSSSSDDQQSSRPSEPTTAGTTPSSQVLTDASATLIRLVMPDAATTKAATDSFYFSSGKLFHVFPRERIAAYHEDVFNGDHLPIRSQKTAACCLASLCAIGVQYNADQFEEGVGETFYNVATHYFSHFLEEQPLDAIKVCTVLAMFNIMGKSTVALAYIEVGLNMSRKYNLHVKHYQHPNVSDDAWADYRRTWRTLVFLSSWLSSTLGYIPGANNNFKEMVPYLDVEGDNPDDIGNSKSSPSLSLGIVQMEMTKISLLKADILRVQLAFKELTGPALESIMKELRDWHDRLPSQMQLTNVGRSDIPDGILLSIFHAHLLYLGAIMLLYRRIASQFVRCFGFEQGKTDSWKAHETTLVNQTTEGVMAAKHSSRILGLMLEKKGIFKRCWVVIFQSQTSCVVLLHSAIQKQLHSFPPESWKDDLAHAHTCLEALAFCGSLDPVALNFHACLEPIYETLLAYGSPPVKPSVPPPPDYLLTIPAGSDPVRVEMSLSLLEALCRPFGDDDTKLGLDRPSSTDHHHTSQAPMSQVMDERLDYGWECAVGVQWDVSGEPLGGVASLEENKFLGSSCPSGWVGGVEVN